MKEINKKGMHKYISFNQNMCNHVISVVIFYETEYKETRGFLHPPQRKNISACTENTLQHYMDHGRRVQAAALISLIKCSVSFQFLQTLCNLLCLDIEVGALDGASCDVNLDQAVLLADL